jgi:long-chain acyl-CoA synthetase
LRRASASSATRRPTGSWARAFSFGQIDDLSRALAAYLQGQGLAKGDRVAVMMPNVPQYPVAVAAVLRAGMVVVNVNPLYTPRELEHQLKDSGAKAIVIAGELRRHAAAGDRRGADQEGHGGLDGRHARLPQGPAGQPRGAQREEDGAGLAQLPGHCASTTRWPRPAHELHAAQGRADDIAVLQYTGGTTGVSKGAVLLHRNLVANVLQAEAWYQPALKKIPPGEQIVTVCALPLYHIFGFNTNMMLGMRMGGCNMLIANPRDIPARSRSCRSTASTAFRRSTRCSTPWPTTPTSTRSTGAT